MFKERRNNTCPKGTQPHRIAHTPSDKSPAAWVRSFTSQVLAAANAEQKRYSSIIKTYMRALKSPRTAIKGAFKLLRRERKFLSDI